MTDLNRLDSRRDAQRDVDLGSQLPPSPAPSGSSTLRDHAALDRAIAAAVSQAAPTKGSSLATFIAAASATPGASAAGDAARNARVQERLNAFRDSACGPYKAEGRTIAVTPQFAMGGGETHENAGDLHAIAARAHLGGCVGAVQVGRGTPEQVTRLTQALIDQGKLESGPPETLATRIHQMQWSYGIGFDCAGYSQQAAVAASGQPRSALFSQHITDAISLEKFHSVPFTSARPGDLFVMKPPALESVGHKTIVFAHTVVSSDAALSEIAKGRGNTVAFGPGGPVHRYELDSSWGADNGEPYGGYHREPSLYNEATKMWAVRSTVDGSYSVSDKPYEHPIQGAYRANVDK